MNRPDSKKLAADQSRPPWAPPGAGSRVLRWGINLCVILHFSAILAAAGSSVWPTSGYVIAIWSTFRPYLQTLFLNHGYNFYAPDIAPSTILDFEATRPDGTVVSGRLPDRSIWPRLLYQRHYLLMEHMGIAPEGFHRAYHRSYANHLCEKYGATKIHLSRMLHYPLPMEMVTNGVRLNDALTYKEIYREQLECNEP